MNSPCLLRELLITHSPTCLKKVISTHFLRWLLKVSLVSLLREARLWVPARTGSGSSSCHPHSHHMTQGVCWQMQPPACLIWSLGLGVDEASRVGLQEGVVHTRDSSSLALEQSSVYVLVGYQRGIVTGSPGPATPTPERLHRGCLVRPPRRKVSS